MFYNQESELAFQIDLENWLEALEVAANCTAPARSTLVWSHVQDFTNELFADCGVIE